jgi:acetyl-CoA carboxylase biotin carboxyl carrier protein
MAAKETPAKQHSDAYGIAEIRNLARILDHFDLSEIAVENKDQKIHLRRERTAMAHAAPMQAQFIEPPASAPTKPIAPVPTEPKDDGSTVITSPFVGTFYRSPSPEAASFVEVGQTVKKGQVLCIVEAMKLMNEIESEQNCKIVDILAKNGTSVEFGQPLFKIFPLA